MDKFTDKISSFEEYKFTDKTKNDIYLLIKENISVNIDGKDLPVERYGDITINGIENLTNSFYNYIKKENKRQEILILEKVKLNASIKVINDRIKNLNEDFQIQ